MIKRTLYFGNPAYLRLAQQQLIVEIPTTKEQHSIPIEDIGLMLLDHAQITISHGLMDKLMANNCAVVTCDARHHPTGMLLPLDGNTLQSERWRHQIQASEPLKKQLWQQTIIAKISNQAAVLEMAGHDATELYYLSERVQSGDSRNNEAVAAAYYWARLFSNYVVDFQRDAIGEPPNHLLNYGYAILRATVARALVASGLLPTLGLHHHNRYNAYCLADDVMEPYRPYVDILVLEMLQNGDCPEVLEKQHKTKLLTIPTLDIFIKKQTRPLMVGLQDTTASLAKCFSGELKKIIYPSIII
jgi:CRISP-associated protein Cas1